MPDAIKTHLVIYGHSSSGSPPLLQEGEGKPWSLGQIPVLVIACGVKQLQFSDFSCLHSPQQGSFINY